MILLYILVGILVLGVFYLFAIAPSHSQNLTAYVGWYFAHRGLHSLSPNTPENSLSAFRQAIAHGYGIELDLQLSRDGQVFVFHDDYLNRVCHAEGLASSYSYPELCRFSLSGTQEHIPLLRDVLALVQGQVPLIIEFKTSKRNRELCEKAWELLKGYPGSFVVESFDPRILAWFKRHHPQVVRGILATHLKPADGFPAPLRFALRSLWLNFLGRPHFIAYEHIYKKNISLAFARRIFHAFCIAWTVRQPSEMDEAHFDLFIFENFLPPSHSG